MKKRGNHRQRTSSMICGILTGCVDGHAPPVLVPEKMAGPFVGYATWDLWSGESRFLPSQHLEMCQLGCVNHSVEHGFLRWVEDVAANATGTWLRRKALSVQTIEVSMEVCIQGNKKHTWHLDKAQRCLRQSWVRCSSDSRFESFGPWIRGSLHHPRAYGNPIH